MDSMDAVIEKSRLTSFYQYFEKEADASIVGYWVHKHYEGPGGRQLEMISFHGGFAEFMEIPRAIGNPEFTLSVAVSREQRLYKHAAYLVGMFANFYFQNEPAETSLRIKTYGNAYQALIAVNTYHVEAVMLTGTLERVDRFGNASDIEISKVTSVILTRKEQV